MIGVRLIYIGIETGQIFIAVEIFLFVWNWGTSEVEGQHFPEMCGHVREHYAASFLKIRKWASLNDDPVIYDHMMI